MKTIYCFNQFIVSTNLLFQPIYIFKNDSATASDNGVVFGLINQWRFNAFSRAFSA